MKATNVITIATIDEAMKAVRKADAKSTLIHANIVGRVFDGEKDSMLTVAESDASDAKKLDEADVLAKLFEGLTESSAKTKKSALRAVYKGFSPTADGRVKYNGRCGSSYIELAKHLGLAKLEKKEAAEKVAEWMKDDEHAKDFAELAAGALRDKYFSNKKADEKAGKAAKTAELADEAETDEKAVTLDDEAEKAARANIAVLFRNCTTADARKALKALAETLGLADCYAGLVKAEKAEAAKSAAETDAKKKAADDAKKKAADAKKAAKAAEKKAAKAEENAKKADEAAKKAAETAKAAKSADEARKADIDAKSALTAAKQAHTAAELARKAAEKKAAEAREAADELAKLVA